MARVQCPRRTAVHLVRQIRRNHRRRPEQQYAVHLRVDGNARIWRRPRPDRAVKAPPLPLPLPFTWTGCYAGGNVAGGWGNTDLTDTTGVVAASSGFTSASLSTAGYMLGGQIGCDYQFVSNWVLGIEGAASGGSIGESTNVAQPSGIP